MGFTPQEVDRMSPWQFMAALEGYVTAHDPEAEKRLTDSEKDELWNWIQRPDQSR